MGKYITEETMKRIQVANSLSGRLFRRRLWIDLACSLAMGAVVWALWRFVFGGVPASGGFLPRLLPVVVCIAAGMAVFVAAALLTGAVSPELLPARLRPKQRG